MGFTCCIMYMQNILEQFFKTKKLFIFCTIVWSNKLFFSPKQGFARKSYFLARMTVYVLHRIITARKEKGWRWHFFHQIEPNWPLPYSTVSVSWLRDQRAGSPIAVYMRAQVQCREPKTGQEKVQFCCEGDWHFLSSYYFSIVYL